MLLQQLPQLRYSIRYDHLPGHLSLMATVPIRPTHNPPLLLHTSPILLSPATLLLLLTILTQATAAAACLASKVASVRILGVCVLAHHGKRDHTLDAAREADHTALP